MVYLQARPVAFLFVLSLSGLLISCEPAVPVTTDACCVYGDTGLLTDASRDAESVLDDRGNGRDDRGSDRDDRGNERDDRGNERDDRGNERDDRGRDNADSGNIVDAGSNIRDVPLHTDAFVEEEHGNGSDAGSGDDANLNWFGRPEVDAVDQSGLSCAADSDLLDKYFRYRRRLRGDGTADFPGFLVPGGGAGHAIPAESRRPLDNCASYWAMQQCPPEDDPNARGVYKWGDGTYWLGDYIAMLGLEYALFKDLGIDTGETERDLYWAIKAIDRLDLAADAYFSNGNSEPDGFYLRDDVPADLVSNASGGYTFPRDDGYSGYECVVGDVLSDCGNPDVQKGSYTSQDQSIGLIFGLGVVAKLLPNGVGGQGFDLRHAARARVHRLVMALRDNGWMVTAPDGSHPPESWGGNAVGFSNQFAKAANTICGTDFGVDDYRDSRSRNVGQPAWAGLMTIWSESPLHTRTLALRLAAFTDDWTADTMAEKALNEGKDFYALIYSLIHESPASAPLSLWRIEALLRSAPCQGPCWGTDGCTNTPGWRGMSRNYRAEHRMGKWYSQEAEFNGIDYMALFAAWHLYVHGMWSLLAPEQSSANCANYQSLDSLRALSASAAEGKTWNPADQCAAADLYRNFCGRPFGAWVHDAMLGRVSIHTGLVRWDCQPEMGCILHQDTSENSDGDDLILGSDANDDYSGGNGNDCLIGFAGDDELRGNQGYDSIEGGEGNDQLYGENSGVVVDGEGDVLWGGEGNDYLRGGPGQDELFGEAGDDDLNGGNQADYLLGGIGNDRLDGNPGDDFLEGADGDDALVGDAGDDQLFGGPGRDKLDGEGGDDYLHGGSGQDFIRGGRGDDTLLSGDGSPGDRLCGNGGDDLLSGNAGDQCLGGGSFLGGTDEVYGCDDDSATTGDCDNGAYNDW